MFWNRKQRERDLDRELRTHVDAEITETGDPQAARRALGNATHIREEVRETWGWMWAGRLMQDLSYAFRNFRRTPGFTAIALLTLALGIGATTAIFSITDAVLLHPLPFPNADRLVVIWGKVPREPNGPPVFNSYRDSETWKRSVHSFEQVAPATWAFQGRIVTGAGPARNVLAMPVGLDFFRMLGIAPQIGRTFQTDDLNRACTVVLANKFWSEAFGAKKDVVGRQISLDQDSCSVVGVMPPDFQFYPDAAAMWMLMTPTGEFARNPDRPNVGSFARLRPGVTIAQAQKDVEAARRNAGYRDLPGFERVPVVYSLAEQFAYLTGPTLRLSVAILTGAVGLVLLIACVNIANLLLTRSLARQRELAVRAALGSGRTRLVRQLLTETLLLSIAGTAAGILLGAVAVKSFRAWNPVALPPGNPVSVNQTVLAFAAALAVLTTILSGMRPALRASRVDPMDALRASGRAASTGPKGGAFARILAAAQVTLSISLLAGAALLIASVDRLASVPLGFRMDHVLTMPLSLPKWSYAETGRRARFYHDVLEQAATLPGIESAALATTLPLNSGRFAGNAGLVVEGKPAPAEGAPGIALASVAGQYFAAMHVPLRMGRTFDARDRDGSEQVAVINDALARKYFAGENPLGRHVRVNERGQTGPWLTIVGVAADEKDRDFFHEMTWVDVPLVFRPIAQQPPLGANLVVHTRADEMALAAALQKQINSLDANVPVGAVETMDTQFSRVLAYPRFRALVLGTFAGLALLLAGIGLYGVLAQSVAQRTQEFGVRLALGAGRGDVLRLVVRQGVILTCAGLAAGLVIALGLTRFLSSLLYGVRATDPWIWLGVSLVLVLVAVVATSIPAWRAARVDPMTALRYE